MAQSRQSLSYLCRGCRHGLQTQFSLPARSFSTTLQRSKTLPVFTPTSSPELDTLLSTFREKVFFPAALSPRHRRLIYKRSNDELLNKDPGVTVTLPDNEEIRLKPMDFYDQPHMRKALSRIIKILSERTDNATWDNVIPFLEGLTSSKRLVPAQFYQRLTRKAGELGKESVIIRCVESPHKTNLRLNIKGVARELFVAFHRRAFDAGFKGGELDSAFARAERIALVLEDEEHCGGKLKLFDDKKTYFQVDARSDPVVLSVLLELSAAKAATDAVDEALIKKVTSYAQKVAYAVEHPPRTEIVYGINFIPKRYEADNRELEEAVIGESAIQKALKLDLDQELTQQLKKTSEALKAKISEFEPRVREQAAGNPRRALEFYDQLQGAEKSS